MSDSLEIYPPYAYRLERIDPGGLPGEEVERRKRLAGVAVAGGLVGVHLDEVAEAALMLPHDPPPKARAYLRSGKSTCALTARGYYLLLGAEHPALDAPYLPRDGLAVADVVKVARDGGAWRTPELGLEPRPGDVVLIGHMTPDGKPDPAWVRGTRATEHALIVTRRRMGVDGDGRLESVDGGQPGVERRTRRVVRAGPGGRELWLAHAEQGLSADGRPLVGRRVVGWVDLPALPTPREAFLPEGCDLGGLPRKRPAKPSTCPRPGNLGPAGYQGPDAPPSPAGRSSFRRQARRQGRTPYGIVTTSASTNSHGGTSTST